MSGPGASLAGRPDLHGPGRAGVPGRTRQPAHPAVGFARDRLRRPAQESMHGATPRPISSACSMLPTRPAPLRQRTRPCSMGAPEGTNRADPGGSSAVQASIASAPPSRHAPCSDDADTGRDWVFRAVCYPGFIPSRQVASSVMSNSRCGFGLAVSALFSVAGGCGGRNGNSSYPGIPSISNDGRPNRNGSSSRRNAA